jgi:hypothetical protein
MAEVRLGLGIIIIEKRWRGKYKRPWYMIFEGDVPNLAWCKWVKLGSVSEFLAYCPNIEISKCEARVMIPPQNSVDNIFLF